MNRVASIEPVPEPVFLVSFLYVPRDGDDTDWYACEFFGRGSDPALRRLVVRVAEENQGLAQRLDRLLGLTSHDNFAEFRRAEKERDRRARRLLERTLTIDVARHEDVADALAETIEGWLDRNKGGNQRRDRQQPRAQNQPSAKQATSQPGRLIKNEHEQALTVAQEEGLDRPLVGDEPKPEDTDIEALWEMVREARDLYHEARKRYESRNQALDTRTAELGEQEQSITARGEELDTRESELAEERTALDKRDGEASERERTLLDRETDIRQREINAERGFIKERQEMLSQLDEAREAFRSELAEKWQASEARLKEREEALDERDDRLAGERRELENVKRRLGYEEADLEELRADLDDRAERRAAAIREELEHSNRSLAAQLEQAHGDRDRHEEMLRQREDADRKFGRRTPDDVLPELDALRAENDKLQAELAERPDAGAAARCRSKGCEAQWELRHDPEIASRVSGISGTDRATESRIPVFRPGDVNPDEWPDDAAPQWVDDILGCDVLAVPVARDGGGIAFLPPRTAPRSP